MAGLLNAKQLVDGSVTPNKLSERYLQVNEQGEVYGDLIVNGNTTLSETATYKGSEIATKGDLYDEGGINDLINDLDEKKQNNLIAGENIQIAPDRVTISSSTKVADSDRVLTYDAAGLKANITLVVDGNQIRVEGKTDESGIPYILGEFNVLQSQIIDDVYVENGHLFITFIVDGNPGKEKVDIDLSEFIDIYEGSDYIDINGQEVSLKYSEVRDKLINDGMASTGQIPRDYVNLSGTQSITGVKTFEQIVYANKDIYSSGKKSVSDGVAGAVLGASGNMYLCASGNSSITFMPGNSSNSVVSIDTTAERVINFYSTGGLRWNGAQLACLSDIPSLVNYVTLNTAQTITGVKIFTNRPYLTNNTNSNAFVIQSDLNSYLTTAIANTTYVALSGDQTIGGVKNFSSRPKVNNTNVATVSDIPSKLPNPNSITFTGGATGSYDGSGTLTVSIPAAITDYVSIAGTQNISGAKNFTGGLTKGGVSVATVNDIPVLVTLSRAQYDALTTKNSNTYYFIPEEA